MRRLTQKMPLVELNGWPSHRRTAPANEEFTLPAKRNPGASLRVLLVILSLLAGACHSACAARRITVEQLSQLLATSEASSKSDTAIAHQLSGLELTERPGPATLAHWMAAPHGPETQEQLVLLTDVSSFLDPPPADLPVVAAPDIAAQRKIIGLTVLYVVNTMPRLPDFFASRVTRRFDDSPQAPAPGDWPVRLGLRSVGTSVTPVAYRDGREIDTPGNSGTANAAIQATSGLVSWGEFGPALVTVLQDAAKGTLAWSHWETSQTLQTIGQAGGQTISLANQQAAGETGTQSTALVAVFHYSVSRENSHYRLQYCCVAQQGDAETRQASTGPLSHSSALPIAALAARGLRVLSETTGYHGSIFIDPRSGTILRLTMEADLKHGDPISRASTMVEYGAVQIGGRNYICPLRSVSLSIAPASVSAPNLLAGSGEDVAARPSAALAAERLSLNDVAFENYHRFGATVSIVNPRESSQPELPVPAMQAPPAEASSGASESEAAGDNAVRTANTALPGAMPSAAIPSPPVPEQPEISLLRRASQFPQLAPQAEGYTLTTTARLVDLGFVATDKHGRPIADVKQSDLEIYDNGVRQKIGFFSPAAPAPTTQPDAPGTNGSQANLSQTDESAASPSPTDASQPTVTEGDFSNQPVSASSSISAAPTTILLLDEVDLAPIDLDFARAESLKFISKLNPAQSVGLYIMNASGFHVLAEPTHDHALLASRFRSSKPDAWKPDASQPDSDATVRPQRALNVLTAVARHLATLPGRKNLIWVSGDRVLVEQRDKFVGSQLNQQSWAVAETLNDAHITVYIVDATAVEVAQGGGDASEAGPGDSGIPSNSAAASSGRGPHPAATSGIAAALRMRQNLRSIQGPMQRLSDLTGGMAFQKSNGLETYLQTATRDAQGAYLAAFTPASPPDGLFHTITLKLAGHRGAVLRYRSGYLAAKPLSDPKEEFQDAVWGPVDSTGIALSAKVVSHAPVGKIQLRISVKDLALDRQSARWTDRVDVFLAERQDYTGHAKTSGETIDLALKPSTYQSMLATGLAYQRAVEAKPETGQPESTSSLRFVVIDESSGRMGSITLPASALQP